ncbi:MAG: hypothetical protein VB071_08465, partial [Lawsonibacter sp.]|nr:hypothetical protein [Lawsonibacter sp.]
MKKFFSLALSLIMVISLLPAVTTPASAENAVVTDNADLDVFMNVDPSVADSTNFKNDVSAYLQWLIANGGIDKTFRINTTAASIDPTDITKWEVYSHYDTVWYSDKADWDADYNGGSIPENWHYYPITDSNAISANNNTTIKTMLDVKNGSSSGTTVWGQVARLKSHIYSFMDGPEGAQKPAMMFYGYGHDPYSDFLYYPASATSTKTVKFDIDASNVLPHSLKHAGFLINAGTNTNDETKITTLSGYVILFSYGPVNSTTAADSLTGIYLYKLVDVNVDTLHSSGLSGVTSSVVASITDTDTLNNLFYTKSHIELSIKSDGLYATIQQLNDSGELIGDKTDLFGTSKEPQTLDYDTTYGGFGPYVDYNSHNCSTTSAFLYSNLEMSFAETLAGSSALEAYQYADYLDDSGQSFFVNLTGSGTTYTGASGSETIPSDTDSAYLSLMQNDKTVLIANQNVGSGTYLDGTQVGTNAQNATSVTDDALSIYYSGSDAPSISTATEKLAAQVAYQIYTAQYSSDSGSTVTVPPTVTIASLALMDSADFDTANQVNQIKKELMTGGNLNVYLNTTVSQNPTETATYTLTKPNGTTSSLTPSTDTENENKLYFTISNNSDWPAGTYKVTLSYTVSAGNTSIPATTAFDVLTDTVAPTPSATISGSTANLTFTNTTDPGNIAYLSPLDSYAAVIDTTDDNGIQPGTPSSGFISVPASKTASVDISDGGTRALGTYYLHMFLKDAAGNVGYAQKTFSVTAPTVAFTTPAENSYTADNQYKNASVTFSLTKGTHDIKTYQIGTGDTTPTYGEAISATGLTNVEYQLPTGEYRLWIKAVDINENESTPINLYVNAKKHQVLSGTDTYTLEAGVDTSATLNITSTSEPALEGEEALSPITYAITTNPGSHVISLNDGVVTVGDDYGTATIEASSAETTTHFAASKTITVNVVKPFSVSLTTAAWNNTGITILPSYTGDGSFGVSDTPELKYRAVGTSTWTTIPADSWSWDTNYTISFSGLTVGTEYEVKLSGQNQRTTPTTASTTLNFKTPGNSSTGTGTASFTLNNTTADDSYYISVRKGDTVLYFETVTGTGGNVPCNLSNLPDGFYNFVVEHGDETVTVSLEIKNGQQVGGSVTVDVGAKSTRVTVDEGSPNVVVDDLTGLFGATANTDNTAGITQDDNTILNNGGAALIELVSTGKTESDVPADVAKINDIKNSQSLALLVDLSLYKTIWASAVDQGTTTHLATTPSLITIAVPLSGVNGSNLTAYRVHENVAQIIPAATEATGDTY